MPFLPILMENNLKTGTTQLWSSIAIPGGGWHTANSILLAARCLEDGDRLLYLCVLSGALHRSVSLQKFTSGSFQMSQFFTSGSQSIAVLALASVLPMNIQDWFPFGLTGLMSFQTSQSPLRVQGTLKSILQHHSSKISILQLSTFFIILCPQRCHILLQICTTKY